MKTCDCGRQVRDVVLKNTPAQHVFIKDQHLTSGCWFKQSTKATDGKCDWCNAKEQR